MCELGRRWEFWKHQYCSVGVPKQLKEGFYCEIVVYQKEVSYLEWRHSLCERTCLVGSPRIGAGLVFPSIECNCVATPWFTSQHMWADLLVGRWDDPTGMPKHCMVGVSHQLKEYAILKQLLIRKRCDTLHPWRHLTRASDLDWWELGTPSIAVRLRYSRSLKRGRQCAMCHCETILISKKVRHL